MADYGSAKSQWESLFRDKSGRDPNAEDYNDFEMKWRHTPEFAASEGGPEGGYGSAESGLRDWDSLLAETGGDLEDRFKDESFGESSADEDGDGISSGGGGGGGGRTNGGAASAQQMADILAAIQAANAGDPDIDLSGIGPGDFPSFEVPGENLSPAIDDVLLDNMEGFDPLGMEDRWRQLLEETEGGGINSARLQSRLEAARENLTRGQVGALSDLRGVLADRGLISMSGSPEGSELDATVRAFEPLQRAFLSESRIAENDESMIAQEAELDALTRATGWTSDMAAQRLAAAGTAQERQQMMATIALGVLDRNIQWNQFAAQFGLDREELENSINQGRMDAILPVLQLFLQLTGAARQGYI